MKRGRAFNPFAVHRLGPRGLDYVFGDADERARLLDAADAHAWRLELVGPHGAGKSTLLRVLHDEAAARGWTAIVWRAQQDAPRLPRGWRWRRRGARVVLLDGAECLPPRQWHALRRATERRGQGLVVTAHEPLGLPGQWRVEATDERIERIVRGLLEEAGADPAAALALARERLAAHQGDARRMFFDLYDAWEDGRLDLAASN